MTNQCFVFLFVVLLSVQIHAQTDTLSSQPYAFGDFGGIVYLDSVTVTASGQSFDVDVFIELVQEDNSFYQAFRNLRKTSYWSDNAIHFFDKNEEQKAHYFATIEQLFDGECRSMKKIEERTGGNFYKKKEKPRYYTARMHQHLFYTQGRVCTEEDVPANPQGMDKHVAELKKLIFKPGSHAEVPIIGKRTAIFSPKIIRHYDFHIRSKMYNDHTDCYIFSATAKQSAQAGKTVIKKLETYFEKEQLYIVARHLHLQYKGPWFSFDVKMQIELKLVDEQYLPSGIQYQGWWNIPFRKPEIAQFVLSFYNFQHLQEGEQAK